MNKKMGVSKSPPGIPASASTLERTATNTANDIEPVDDLTMPSKRSRAEDNVAEAADDDDKQRAADDNLTNVSQALASGAGADYLLVAFAMNKEIEMKDFIDGSYKSVCREVELQVSKSECPVDSRYVWRRPQDVSACHFYSIVVVVNLQCYMQLCCPLVPYRC